MGKTYYVYQFHQNQYIVITERMEIVSYNKDYMNYTKSTNFKYNGTSFGINYTLKSIVVTV